MYIPAAVAETDLTRLHDFIEQNSFGLLVSQVDGVAFATHLPFLLERTTGPHGTLICHVARTSPQMIRPCSSAECFSQTGWRHTSHSR
jgi:transcriptional regulator